MYNLPRAGVLVMSGGVSSLIEFKASLLAARGFAALALDYIGPDLNNMWTDAETGRDRADLNYWRLAARFLSNGEHARVRRGGIGVASLCFSVHIALLMAATLDTVRCVVAINGCCWNMTHDYELDGRVVSTATDNRRFFDAAAAPGTYMRLNERLQCPTPTLAELRASSGGGVIPFYKREDVAYLMLVGEDDALVPSPHYARVFAALLEAAGHRRYSVLRYAGAGHMIQPPYAPANVRIKTWGRYIQCGGRDLEKHAAAQEAAWTRQLEFLRENLAG